MFDLSKITITHEMLTIIAEIDEFKGAWQTLGRITPERLDRLKKVATIESIGSSTRIEGSQLSDSQIEILLSNVGTNSFVSRDEQEVAGYAYVCEQIFQSFQSIELTENIIKQLHGWLLKFSDKDERHRGNYKTHSNNVEAFDEDGKSLGIIFETSSPFKAPFEMENLVAFLQSESQKRSTHSLLIIGIFIVVFLAIHPFQDGNGRLSRILTTLLLLKAGYLYAPYSSLESIIEKNKESYYLALRRTQGSLKSKSPNFDNWIMFFLKSLQKQKIHLEQKIVNEKALLNIPRLSIEIISMIKQYKKLSISDIEQLTKANRNTIKKHLITLESSEQIIKMGRGKATYYMSI